MFRSSPISRLSGGSRFGIFAKYWQAGAVKTRLARVTGPEVAANLHRVFVQTLLNRFRQLPATRVVVVTPWERQSDFARLAGPDWKVASQSSGDLGERMAAFFRTSLLEHEADRVVLIGSDSPTLPVHYVEHAFELLASNQVVLGPSADGGYYLVGAARDVPPMFHHVAWSTPLVWDQTVRWLQGAQIPFAELPPWYDVDDEQDLRRLAEELRQKSDGELHDLILAVQEALGIVDG